MDEATGGTVLVIGAVSGPEGAVHLALTRIDVVLLARLAPVQVICGLFDASADAMAVAERLAECGWSGRLTVLAPGLPDRRMVQRELQAVATGITVEVIAGH